MARVGFSSARTGRVNSGSRKGGGKFMKELQYSIGESKNLVIPTTEDGAPIIYAFPIHKVVTQGTVQLPKADGGSYRVYTIRCSHPYSQISEADQKQVVKNAESCVYCDLANYRKRQVFKEIQKEFPNGEFSKLTKEEQKAFYEKMDKELPQIVEESYYSVKTDSGTVTKKRMDMYLLVLELQLDKNEVVLDENGLPVYEPVLFKCSEERLNKIAVAVENAVATRLVADGDLTKYVENEGTEFESEVSIGWLQYYVNFPDLPTKQASGKGMTVSVIPTVSNSITDEFKQKVMNEMEDVLTRTNNYFSKAVKNLQIKTRKEAVDSLVIHNSHEKGRKYFYDLENENKNVEEVQLADGRILPPDDVIFQNAIENTRKRLNMDESEVGSTSEETEGLTDDEINEEIKGMMNLSKAERDKAIAELVKKGVSVDTVAERIKEIKKEQEKQEKERKKAEETTKTVSEDELFDLM